MWLSANGEIFNHVELRRRAGREGAPLRDGERLRGDRARVRGVGRRGVLAARGAVRVRAVGRARAAARPRPRPARDPAPALRRGRRRRGLRLGGEGALRAAGGSSRGSSRPRSGSSSRPGRSSRPTRSSPASGPSGPAAPSSFGARRVADGAPLVGADVRAGRRRTAGARAGRRGRRARAPPPPRGRAPAPGRRAGRRVPERRARLCRRSAASASKRPGPAATFGVGFTDARYDETAAANEVVARLLGTRHHDELLHGRATSRRVLDEAVWSCEIAAAARAARVPLFLLARSVRGAGMKAVFSGEGADELLAGYSIFKEDRVRRFWARDPGLGVAARARSRAVCIRMSPTARCASPTPGARSSGGSWRDTDDPFYSHRIRWRNNTWALRVPLRRRPRRRRARRRGRSGRARAPGRLAALAGARTRAGDRDPDVHVDVPPRAAGRPCGDGARRRGAVPVPRRPTSSTSRRGCRPRRSSSVCTTRSPCDGSPADPAGGGRRAREASVPRAGRGALSRLCSTAEPSRPARRRERRRASGCSTGRGGTSLARPRVASGPPRGAGADGAARRR